MKATAALEKYLKELNATNRSDTTISTYRFHIKNYFDFTDTRGDADVRDICTEHFYFAYLNHLKERGLKDVTMASYAASIKAFNNWLIRHQLIGFFEMPIPKFQLEIPSTYTDEELSILLKRPENGICSSTEYVTYVMINVFAATGMRLRSLCNLRVKDIDFNAYTIEVNTTKNNLPIKLPVNAELISILMAYISRLRLSREDPLFCTAAHTPYSKRTVEDYVRDYEAKRGIKKERCVHAFRHSFAKNYYKETKDVLKLSHILGHQDLSVTNRYLQALGFTFEGSIEYNPQALYAPMLNESREKRRGRIVLDDDPKLPF